VIRVEIPEHNAVVEFPDDMTEIEMKEAIDRQFYGIEPDISEEVAAERPYPAPEQPRKKGLGYFGKLPYHDGRESTELSIGVDWGEGETEIPSLVPTLNQKEIDYLLAGNDPTPEIEDKAVAHARQRISAGKDPFAQLGEQREPIPEVPDYPIPAEEPLAPEVRPEDTALEQYYRGPGMTEEPGFEELPVGEPRVLGEAVQVPFLAGRAIARAPGAFTEAEPFDIERKEASISDLGGQLGRKIVTAFHEAGPGPRKIRFEEGELRPGDAGEVIGRTIAEMGVEIGTLNILLPALLGSGIEGASQLTTAIKSNTRLRMIRIPERNVAIQNFALFLLEPLTLPLLACSHVV